MTTEMKTVGQIYRPKNAKRPIAAGMSIYLSRKGKFEARLRNPKDGRPKVGTIITTPPDDSIIDLRERL